MISRPLFLCTSPFTLGSVQEHSNIITNTAAFQLILHPPLPREDAYFPLKPLTFDTHSPWYKYSNSRSVNGLLNWYFLVWHNVAVQMPELCSVIKPFSMRKFKWIHKIKVWIYTIIFCIHVHTFLNPFSNIYGFFKSVFRLCHLQLDFGVMNSVENKHLFLFK